MKRKRIRYSVAVVCSLLLVQNQRILALAVQPNQTIDVSLACGDVEGSIDVKGSNASIVSFSPNFCDRGKSIEV